MDYWLKEGFNRKLNFCKCEYVCILPPPSASFVAPCRRQFRLCRIHKLTKTKHCEKKPTHTHISAAAHLQYTHITKCRGSEVNEIKCYEKWNEWKKKEIYRRLSEERHIARSGSYVCLLKLYQTSKQININSLSLWNAGAYTRNRLYASDPSAHTHIH